MEEVEKGMRSNMSCNRAPRILQKASEFKKSLSNLQSYMLRRIYGVQLKISIGLTQQAVQTT